MKQLIDYISFCLTKIVDILNSISLPGSLSLLHYILGAVILVLIFKFLKGGSDELYQGTTILTSRIVSSSSSKYSNNNELRKKQIVQIKNDAKRNGLIAGTSLADGNVDEARYWLNK